MFTLYTVLVFFRYLGKRFNVGDTINGRNLRWPGTVIRRLVREGKIVAA